MKSDYIVREARGRRLEPDRIDGRQQRKGEGEGSEHAIASKKRQSGGVLPVAKVGRRGTADFILVCAGA